LHRYSNTEGGGGKICSRLWDAVIRGEKKKEKGVFSQSAYSDWEVERGLEKKKSYYLSERERESLGRESGGRIKRRGMYSGLIVAGSKEKQENLMYLC